MTERQLVDDAKDLARHDLPYAKVGARGVKLCRSDVVAAWQSGTTFTNEGPRPVYTFATPAGEFESDPTHPDDTGAMLYELLPYAARRDPAPSTARALAYFWPQLYPSVIQDAREPEGLSVKWTDGLDGEAAPTNEGDYIESTDAARFYMDADPLSYPDRFTLLFRIQSHHNYFAPFEIGGIPFGVRGKRGYEVRAAGTLTGAVWTGDDPHTVYVTSDGERAHGTIDGQTFTLPIPGDGLRLGHEPGVNQVNDIPHRIYDMILLDERVPQKQARARLDELRAGYPSTLSDYKKQFVEQP